MDARTLRLVTHRDVSRADCERAAASIREVVARLKRDLGALAAREHDLLVVGGGIHGAAAAWDAAQRGLAVALVEAGDFGSGTSWNSLKTIHGGLRHLQRRTCRACASRRASGGAAAHRARAGARRCRSSFPPTATARAAARRSRPASPRTTC